MDSEILEDANIDGVVLTPLKRIENPKGDVYHIMKESDSCFQRFGEAYFTTVHNEVLKGWKRHTKMQMNLVVPVGSVTFFIHDEKLGKTKKFTLNRDNYCRLTVPPGLWMAFKGQNEGVNLVLNMASIEHDPLEAKNAAIETFSLECD